jgi:tRNA G18 (ribose-2'-O)-methylase SpoU
MKPWDFTREKFLSLQEAHQHKMASELLKEVFSSQKIKDQVVYRNLEEWLHLPSINLGSHEQVSDRFHFHLAKAGIAWKEHSLLYVKKQDSPSSVPFLPVHIFLTSLRSAFNVGSILRTVEAFRLGSVHFSSTTPTTDNPKVQKASMGTYDKVVCYTNCSIEQMPRPWIALETATPSTPLSSFSFPKSFTLILGNEEFGVPQKILHQCDTILEIPLYGSKNSLNVASAFAIATAAIAQQLHS